MSKTGSVPVVRSIKRKKIGRPAPQISVKALAELGGGRVAYIITLNAKQAKKQFPSIEGIPAGVQLFALYAADGTPLALTDSRQAAVGHAIGDELEIVPVH